MLKGAGGVTSVAARLLCETFAQSKMNLRLLGGELVDLVLDHYDQLDSKYKGLIPLKRVHIPQTIE